MPDLHPSEELYRGKRITLRVETLAKPGGAPSRLEIVEHPESVAIVALRERAAAEPEVVLVYQQRPAIGKALWEIPAGILEAREQDQPELAAARELREETGYTAQCWQFLSRVYPSPGFCIETQILSLARQVQPAPGVPPDGTPTDAAEIAQIRWLALSEALCWCLRGEIVDSKTILGLYLTAHGVSQAIPG